MKLAQDIAHFLIVHMLNRSTILLTLFFYFCLMSRQSLGYGRKRMFDVPLHMSARQMGMMRKLDKKIVTDLWLFGSLGGLFFVAWIVSEIAMAMGR